MPSEKEISLIEVYPYLTCDEQSDLRKMLKLASLRCSEQAEESRSRVDASTRRRRASRISRLWDRVCELAR